MSDHASSNGHACEQQNGNHDNHKDDNNEQQQQDECDEDLDEFGDDKNSILAEAIACNQSIQIMRAPRNNTPNNNNNRMSIMSFFGGPAQADEPEEVVTAEPASLQNMRRAARAARQRQSELLPSPPLVVGTGSLNGPPSRRGVRRYNTSVPGDRMSIMPLSSSTTAATSSTGGDTVTRTDKPPLRASSPKRPLSRSRTAVPQSRPLTPNNYNNGFLPGLIMGEPQSPRAATASRDSNSNSNSNAGVPYSPRNTSFYTEHEETIKRLTVHDEEIQKLLQDPKAFAKLQNLLRKHGAITNEVLKQVLPLYVKHQSEKDAAEAAKKQQQQQQQQQATQQEGDLKAMAMAEAL